MSFFRHNYTFFQYSQTFSSMEIKAKHYHPGEEIVSNNLCFSLKVNPTPYDMSCHKRKNNCIFYLFLCPCFKNTDIPLTAENPNEAPFQISTNIKRIKVNRIYPAYFIYKGQAHFWYQLKFSQMQPIDLKVKVTLRPLLTIGKQHRFELTQLIMFSDIGSF